MRDKNLQTYLTANRWSMYKPVLDSLCGIMERHIAGQKLSAEQIRMVTDNKKIESKKYELTADGKAVIHVTGVIAKYSTMVNDISQPEGTSIESLSEQLDAALYDPKVRAIFLRIESPGGSMAGLPDFADKVWAASFIKPVIAFADDMAGSAADWLGSQANLFIANQSAEVGSIGVYMVVPDYSKAAEMEGIKFNVIATGANKGAGYPGSVVTEGQLAVWQSQIDADFEMFLAAVYRGRSQAGLSMENLRSLADGRMYPAAEALENKLIDKIMTLSEALAMDLPDVRDENETRTAASAENVKSHRKEQDMKEDKVTQAASPDAAAEAKATAAVDQERSRIMGIQSALAGTEFKALSDKAIAEGWDLKTAKAEAFDIAQARRAEETKAAGKVQADMQTRLDAIANSGHADELKGQSDTTTENPLAKTKCDEAAAQAFEKGIDDLVAANHTRANAIAKMARRDKEGHRAWIASKQKK